MTAKERVAAVLRHEIPDRAPCSLFLPELTEEEKAAYTRKYGDDFVLLQGQDLVECQPGIPFPSSPYRMVDGIPWFHSPIISDDYHEVDELVFSDPDNLSLYEELRHTVETHPHQAVCFNLVGPFTILHGMRLMENIYLDVYENPDGLHRVLDKIWSVSRRVLENVLKMDLDLAAIFFLDDIAAQKSLLFSPKTLEEFFFPYMREVVAMAKAKGLPVLFHSDGDLTQVLPTLVDIGVTAPNPMQPTCNDMAEFKRLYQGKLVCYGGLDNTGILLHGTPDDVRRHVQDLFETVGKDGGLIFTYRGEDPRYTRENLLSLYEAVMDCRYDQT